MGTVQWQEFYLGGPSELQLSHPHMEGVALCVSIFSWDWSPGPQVLPAPFSEGF